MYQLQSLFFWSLRLLLLLIGGVVAPGDPAVASQSYRLGPNDVIRIQVFGEEDLTVETRVGGDGTINFPLLGALAVQGHTVTEVQDHITGQLAKGYVRKPNVTVRVVRHRNFYVTGEVRNPGGYPFEDNLTVQQALSLAGGLTDKAEKTGVLLKRVVQGQAQSLQVGPDTAVLPDDTLVISPNKRIYIMGEVTHPGAQPFEDGLTVQKALSLAGGLTEKAEKGSVKITRVADGTPEIRTFGYDAGVKADDILIVEPANHKIYASGEVKLPGGYPFRPGLTVHQVVAMAGGLTDKAARGEVHLLRHADGPETQMQATFETAVQPDDIVVIAEAQRFFVSGEVRTPGRYVFERGLTVQKALSLAGGLTERADPGSVKATRVTDGLVEILQLKHDALIRADDILVVESANHKFYASGEVKTPGGYTYKDGLTVHQALAMAGGLTEKAARTGFYLLRHNNQHEESIPAALDTIIVAEDIVVVPEGQRFYIGGQVRTPGRYLLEPNLTVQKALTMAGGITDKAERGSLRVTRTTDGVQQTLDATLETPILPNDLVVIPETKKVYVNGEVKRAGDYAYEQGLTVHKLITMAGGFTDKASSSRAKLLRHVEGKEYSISVDLDAVVQPEDILVIPRSFF